MCIRDSAVLDVGGEDHLTHGRDTVGVEEHVLGTGEADALGAQTHGVGGVTRGDVYKRQVEDTAYEPGAEAYRHGLVRRVDGFARGEPAGVLVDLDDALLPGCLLYTSMV